MKTLVVGYYGMRNFGDDLFCVVAAHHRIAVQHERDLLFACPRIPGLEADFLVPAGVCERLYGREDRVGSLTRTIFGLIGYLRASTILLAGGSVLERVHGVRRLQLVLHTLGLKRRWLAAGVSLGPFADASAKAAVSHLLRNFDALWVRDHDSASLAQEMSIAHRTVLGTDLAALLPSTSSAMPIEDGPLVIVPYGGLSLQATQTLIEHLAAGLREQSERRRIVLLTLNNHSSRGDDQMAAFASTQLKRYDIEHQVVRYDTVGLAGVIDLLASASALITGRLHGGIVAYLNSVPFVLLEHHHKMTSFLDDIEQPPVLRPRMEDPAMLRQAVDALLTFRFCARPPESLRREAKEAHHAFDALVRKSARR